jgi:hypothetical protein
MLKDVNSLRLFLVQYCSSLKMPTQDEIINLTPENQMLASRAKYRIPEMFP